MYELGCSMHIAAANSLAPNNPVCRVQVKCRGIEYKHLGLLGAEHCDASATDSSGVVHSLSGGPDGDPLNSTLNAWDTPNPTIPFTGWTVYNNLNSCSLAGCVINSTNQYHNSTGQPAQFCVLRRGRFRGPEPSASDAHFRSQHGIQAPEP